MHFWQERILDWPFEEHFFVNCVLGNRLLDSMGYSSMIQAWLGFLPGAAGLL